MRWIEIGLHRGQELVGEPAGLPTEGLLWLDLLHDEVAADTERLQGTVQRLTGVRIFDLHVQDAVNLQHPSYFDSTNEYDMLVFRKLAYGDVKPLEEKARPANQRRMLQEIVTRPITFFIFDRLLVTVQQGTSRTLDQVRQRILDPKVRAEGLPFDRSRLPKSPGELMLRILNGLVDRYLELREPLSDRLDRWQRDLLDPDRPFTNWSALLEARIELRRLENLCEGQYDALTELRDAYLEETDDAGLNDAYLVRLNDVLEHIQRVLHHARRLEASAESAVQLHFSANTHQTNEIVRKLTAIAAIFAPLTLLAGMWGMNFERVPLAHHPDGFWIVTAGFAAIALVMLIYFWARRILSRPRSLKPPRWLR
jgi:Mg2+ and Co2+ transporter CorA